MVSKEHVLTWQKWFIAPGMKMYYCSCGAHDIRAWTKSEALKKHLKGKK